MLYTIIWPSQSQGRQGIFYAQALLNPRRAPIRFLPADHTGTPTQEVSPAPTRPVLTQRTVALSVPSKYTLARALTLPAP